MKKISLINRWLGFVLAVSVSAVLSTSAYGEWVEQKKIRALEDASDNYFGYSAVVDANYAIVGAYGDTEDGYEQVGSAYIFKLEGTGWTQQTKLRAGSPWQMGQLGYSVSLSGDYCIAGAPGDDDQGVDAGSAYIFKREGENWTQKAKLTASDGSAGDGFGGSVSISADYVIVGASKDDEDGTRSGSAYIFKRDPNTETWVEQIKLKRSQDTPFDELGISVFINGTSAIVGAHYGNGNTNSCGAAHIYAREPNSENWIEQARVTSSDGAVGDRFGYSVAIEGDYAVIGSHKDDDRGDSSGSVYVFKWDGYSWVQQSKITASDGTIADFFGYNVSINNERIIAGTYGEDDYGSNFGCAYILRREGTS